MESLLLLAFVGALLLIAILANYAGHDSRDGIETNPQPPFWIRPDRS